MKIDIYDHTNIYSHMHVFKHIYGHTFIGLERAGISTIPGAELPITPGGIIEIDPSTQLPTGMIKERATELIIKAMGVKSQHDKKKFILDGLDICRKFGLTSVQTNDENAYEVYKELQRENQLPIRVFLTPMHHELKEKSFDITRENTSFHDASSRLSVHRVKIFGDGALGSETAALRSDIETSEHGSAGSSMTGILIHESNELRSMILEARKYSLRVEIHAIGDAAASQVLDVLESIDIQPQERPIMTHCQVLGDDLIVKMKRLGVIANVQPSFVPTDMRWIMARLSKEKQLYSYAWKTLINRDVCVVGGSDAPIETSSPLVGMYDAIYRCSRLDNTLIFRGEEMLTFEEALYIYTVSPAFSAGCENYLGKIKEGYAADLVFMDPIVLENPKLLKSIEPHMALVGGNIVLCQETDKAMAVNIHSNNDTLSISMGDSPYIPGKNGGLFVDTRNTMSMPEHKSRRGQEYGNLFAEDCIYDSDYSSLLCGETFTPSFRLACRCCKLWK